jgi:hypothetical protein
MAGCCEHGNDHASSIKVGDILDYLNNCYLAMKDIVLTKYEGVTKSLRTGRLERELQMVELSATRRSYIAIL